MGNHGETSGSFCLALILLGLRGWLILGVTLLLVLGVSFLAWMLSDIYHEHRAEAQGDFDPVAELLRLAKRLIPAFFDTLLCYGFIYFWLMRYRVRSQVARLTTVVFLAAGLIGMLEKLVKVVKQPLTVAFFARHPSLEALRHGCERFFDHPVTWITLIVIEVLLIRHHSREPAHHHHERTTLAVLKEMLTPLTRLNTELGQQNLTPKTRDELEKQYWNILSKGMKRLFRERNVADLDLCIMRWNPATDHLSVEYESDPILFDHTFTLAKGEGAAGNALLTGHAVYIPVIRYRHAVGLVPQADDSIKMRVLLNVYKKGTHPFTTMLSVPIITETSGAVGVLNLSSGRKSAFKGSDFNIANLTAVILGLMNR